MSADIRTVSVVHDYITQRGGAERVALLFAQRFGGGAISALVADKSQTFEDFAAVDVRSSWLSRIPVFRRDPRNALPLLPIAVMTMRVPRAVVTLCSSSGWAHGVRCPGAKVVYCHNVARWLYQPDAYYLGLGVVQRFAGRLLKAPLVAWDQWRARTVHEYIANSRVVADRIAATYGREATVIHPPVSLDVAGVRTPVAGLSPGFYLTVSRARGYKRTREIVEAFRTLEDRRLVVVGHLASADEAYNVVGVGRVSDAELRWLYAQCGALVAVSDEDFGLTPIECFSFGRPVLALRAGGYLETVVDGRTGVFTETAQPADIREAVLRLEAVEWNPRAIRDHAEQWSVQNFLACVGNVLDKYSTQEEIRSTDQERPA